MRQPFDGRTTPLAACTSLRERLLRSHLLVATIGIVLVATAVGAALYVRTATLRLATETDPAVQAATRALSGVDRAVSAMRAWVATGDQAFLRDHAFAWTHDVDPALASLQEPALRWDPRERRWFAEAAARIREIRMVHDRVQRLPAAGAPWSTVERHAMREVLAHESLPQVRRTTALLNVIAAGQEEKLRVGADRLAQTIDVGITLFLVLLAVAAVLTIVVSIRIADRVTRPLTVLAAATGALADRTLTTDLPVERDDEIGALTRAFNHMRASVVDAERALTERATEAMQAHAALQAEYLERTQAEARFRQLLEAAPDPILIVDAAGTIALVNAATERLFGYRRDELLGTTIGTLMPSALEWSKLLVEARGDAGEAGEADARRAAAVELELLALRRDGAAVPVEIRANPLIIDARTLLAIAVRDVTDRHRAESELRRLNAELEQRVFERTVELRRSNEELERFAAIASHDLQEPLRMVASYTALLADRYRGRLDADADEFIAYAVDGARRMQRLVGDLLAYARVSTRARPLELVDAGAIFDRTVANLRLAIAERGAVVEADALPRVRADGSQLGQMLQNLVDNALKYAGDRPTRVQVSAERGRDAWIFSVRDNGVGIAPEHAERVFALFERLHRDTGRPGSGIGLALCKKIVERHGGRIWVESVVGTGSTFRFTLPFHGGDVGAATAPSTSEAGAPSSSAAARAAVTPAARERSAWHPLARAAGAR